jgi:FKBP-type peptidyl-prolyl cis-trans isomerase 2
VEIEYTGTVKEDGSIFDTTQEKVAKEKGVYDKNMHYHPAVVCIGENYVLKSLEEQMVGKETGREYQFEIEAEKAFGKKDMKLIQMIPLSKFRKQNIQPMPGLQLNIDGVFGLIKTVSGGRVLVDFNHPLAGKDIVYDVKINRIVQDSKEKIKSLLDIHLHAHDAEVSVNGENAGIKLKQKIPKEAQEEFKKIVERTVPAVRGVAFEISEEQNK